jgi:hypothetical protein
MRGSSGFRRLIISLLTLLGAMTTFSAPAQAGDDCYSSTVGAWNVIDDPACMLEVSRTVTSGPDSIFIRFFHEGQGLYRLSVNTTDITTSLTEVSVEYPGSGPVPASQVDYYGRYTSDLGTPIAAALYLGGSINIYVTYSTGKSTVFTVDGTDFKRAIDSAP